MTTSPPESDNPSPPEHSETAAEMRAPAVVPGWARGAARRRRTLSRRNVCVGIVGIIVLGFLVWLNFPFIPDPIILLTRQPADIFASSSVGDQWTMAGRTVGQTRHAADALAVPEGRLVWSADTGPATLAAPVISDNLIFLPGHFRIAVLNPGTGDEVDSIPTSGPMHNSVALAQENIYYATIDRRVVAMDAETHQQRWEYPIADSTSGPVAVAGGIVYAGGLDGVTYAINAVTGEHIWRHSSLSEVRSPAAVGNQVVYVAAADRSLYALDARTGQERARFRSSAQLVAAPVLANELVYFVSGGQLFAMDANVIEFPGRYAVTRVWAQLWLWGFPLPAPPSQPGDRWRFVPEGKAIDGIISAPAVTADGLFVGDLLGNLYAIDPVTGQEQWRFEAEDAIAASPVVIGDLLVFGDKSGWVYGLDHADGRELWRLGLSAAVRTDPVYAGGRLLIRTDDGWLHAIE